MDDLAHHRSKHAKLPIKESDLPQFPPTWVLRKLKPIASPPYPWFSLIIGPEYGLHTRTHVAPIPQLTLGAPFQVTAIFAFNWHGPGAWATVKSSIKKTDGSQSKLFSDVRLERDGEKTPPYSQIIPYENDMESIEFVFTALNGAVGFWPLNLLA